MNPSSLFHWFACCFQPEIPPPPDTLRYNKSHNSSFNTDHYTEQMKEAFFNKLLLHKGLCNCQEVSFDLILPENFRIINSMTKYPKRGQMFLLKYGSSAGILATITTANFSTRSLKKNPKAFQSHLTKVEETPKEKEDQELESADVPVVALKSSQNTKMKQEFSKLVKGMPEEMIEHLIQRFGKGEFIVDLMNGIHSLSLQLAIKGMVVLAIEKSLKHLTLFRHNAGLWDFTDSVMAVQGDFLEMKLDSLKPDAIVVNFKAETIDLLKEKFCLFKHVKPNIRETLKRATSITNKILLILPKHVEIDEIALVFKDYFDSCHEKNQTPIGTSIEIECLTFNNKLEKIAVYFGAVSSITLAQEIEYIKSVISEEKDLESPALFEYFRNQISTFLRKLTKRFGIHKISPCLIGLENISPHITHFQAFIEQTKRKLGLSNEEVIEYLSPDNSEKEEARSMEMIQGGEEEEEIYEDHHEYAEASFHSWEISSTPAFLEVSGLKETRKKFGGEECKSAELIPKKGSECFSFK